MTMVAVKSTSAKTGLIPVCVTAEDPNSTVLVKLVSMGVRVIYHRPTWLESAEQFWEKKNASLTQLNALVAQWLRIDIPILGCSFYWRDILERPLGQESLQPA